MQREVGLHDALPDPRRPMIPTPGSPWVDAGSPVQIPAHGLGTTQPLSVAVKVRGGFLSMFAEGWNAYRRGFRQFLSVWLTMLALLVGVMVLILFALMSSFGVALVAGLGAFVGLIAFGIVYLVLSTRRYAIALDSVDRRPGKSSGARWLALLGWGLLVSIFFQIAQYVVSRVAWQQPETLRAVIWIYLAMTIVQMAIWVYLPFAVVEERSGVLGLSISLIFRTFFHVLVLSVVALAAFYGLTIGIRAGLSAVAPLFGPILSDASGGARVLPVVLVVFGWVLVTLVVGGLIHDYVLCVLAVLYRSRVGGVAYEETGGLAVIPPYGGYGQIPGQSPLFSPAMPLVHNSPFPTAVPALQPHKAAGPWPAAAPPRFPLIPEPSPFDPPAQAPLPLQAPPSAQAPLSTHGPPPDPPPPVPPTPPRPPGPRLH